MEIFKTMALNSDRSHPRHPRNPRPISAAAVCVLREGESPGGKALVFRDFLFFPGIRNWGSTFQPQSTQRAQSCAAFSLCPLCSLWFLNPIDRIRVHPRHPRNPHSITAAAVCELGEGESPG
jgi:hypothetical protein